MTHTTVLLLPSPPSLQTCPPPRTSGLLLQWWYWRCRVPREQGVHWRCPGQRGRHQRSAVARWTQESCTPSWSRCVVLRVGVSCTPTGKPGRMQNHNVINEHRAHLEFSWQRAAFWQMLREWISSDHPHGEGMRGRTYDSTKPDFLTCYVLHIVIRLCRLYFVLTFTSKCFFSSAKSNGCIINCFLLIFSCFFTVQSCTIFNYTSFWKVVKLQQWINS